MLPTCIGISAVSRYRNEASIEDSFLASLIFSSRETNHAAPWWRFWRSHGPKVSGHRSGLCIFRGRICNGKRSRSVKLLEFALGLRQAIGHRPQRGGGDAQANVTGEIHLDILGRFRGA